MIVEKEHAADNHIYFYRSKKQPFPVQLIFLLYLCLITCINHKGYAQDDLIFTHLEKKDGLPDNRVRYMTQDSFGYIWVTSPIGVSRYDGYNFKSYTSGGGHGSLSHSNCPMVMADKKERIWVLTRYGVNLYDRNKDNFRQYFLSVSDSNRVQPNNVFFRAGFSDAEGKTCFIDESGFMSAYDEKSDKLVLILNKTIQFNPKCTYTDTSGHLWVGTGNGLSKVNAEKDNITYYKKGLLENAEIWSVVKYSGHLWLAGLSKGVLKYNTETGAVSRVSIPGIPSTYYAHHLMVDNDGLLWISTSDGLVQYNKHTTKFKLVSLQKEKSDNDSKTRVLSVFEDKQQLLWVARDEGLSYSLKYRNFHYYGQKDLNTNNLFSSVMLDYKGNLWVGSEDSEIYIFNPETNNKVRTISALTDGSRIGSGILNIYEAADKQVYAGAYKTGLLLFVPEKGQFREIDPTPPHSTTGRWTDVRSCAEDADGNIWIVSHGHGFCKFIPDSAKFKYFEIAEEDYSLMSEMWIFDIDIDKEGTVYFAHPNGISLFFPDNLSFKHYVHDRDDTTSVSAGVVAGAFDPLNNYWVGTYHELNYFDRNFGKFIRFGIKNGLSGNAIRAINFDSDTNLWLSHNEGLTQLVFTDKHSPSAQGLQVSNYGSDDNIGADAYLFNSTAKSKEGTLYFGGSKAITCFNPAGIRKNTMAPNVVLSDFLLLYKSVPVKNSGQDAENQSGNFQLDKHINETNRLTLKYNQNIITFRYAGINHIQSEKNKYMYKLEGFDKKWHNIGTKREITFTNLAPGTYTLKIKAANSDGFWSETPKSIEIEVLPPWWKTLAFRIALFVVLLLVVAGIIKIRTKLLQEQKRILKNEVDRQTRSLIQQAEQLNEINTQLEEKNQFIEEQTEELQSQKEQLQQKQQELFKRNDELSVKNEKLNTLNATKDTLFSIIAHDLKNPFSSVIGLLELLRKNYDRYTDEKRNKFLDNIAISADNIYKLLENLLYWARSQTKSIDFDPMLFPLNEIITSNINLYLPDARKKGITLVNNIPNDINIFGDKRMLDTVIRNLLNNAIKYTNSGTVNFSIQKAKSNICVIISDTGKGMTKEKAETLFEVKKNKSTPGTTGERGTGLGLIICNEFVQYHNGSIEVKSEVDKGSRFLITLPI